MSFSQDVKTELLQLLPRAKHCQIAELCALVSVLGTLQKKDGNVLFLLDHESDALLKKIFTLAEKTITIEYREITDFLMHIVGIDADKNSSDGVAAIIDESYLKQNCCKKAYLRGMFLSAGTMSHPQKSYHLEIACREQGQAEQLSRVMNSLGVTPKIAVRKDRTICYLKEAAQISEMLGLMGASVSYMQMENVRILKEMRGNVNRRVNCETSNITKTVTAGMRQLQDIEFLHQSVGLEALPAGLTEIAYMRRKHPRVSLQELGELLDPPIGKSGVNHRLRRISQFANDIRQKGENE